MAALGMRDIVDDNQSKFGYRTKRKNLKIGDIVTIGSYKLDQVHDKNHSDPAVFQLKVA